MSRTRAGRGLREAIVTTSASRAVILGLSVIVVAGAAAVLRVAASADTAPHAHGQAARDTAPGAATGQPGPHRVTMEEMHRSGGVPRGWKFTVPPGDPARGRQLFADLECYKCHAVAGERFAEAEPDPRDAGPPLTGVGRHHPAEYLAESILDPNAVIVTGPGFTGPDGRSVMPSYADVLTLAQWADLVAYLKSLTGGEAHGPAATGEVRTGPYRVRVAFAPSGHHPGGGVPGLSSPGAHGHAPGATGHTHGTAGHQALAGGHLMVFVNDAETGEPVPYLPVSVRLHGTARTTPALRLEPMLGDEGFHYGADVTPPPGLRRVTVVLGQPTVKAFGPRPLPGPVQADIEWPAAH
ncbi:MAG TPA: c-type cytochrome [Calidithermus sp.]|nr:c-type cytochrome [Calidithermus sp.]